MKLIVGIDPGTTTAIALLDTESEYYHVYSQRNFSLEELCEYIVGYGDPIIVATDVENPPDLVRKAATIFNARLFSPSEITTIRDKKQITNGKKISNDHERDALAAALMAKKYYSELFEKIDDVLSRKDLSELGGDVKELIIKREVGNIEQAIEFLTEEEKEHGIKVVYKLAKTKRLVELERKIKDLEKTKTILEKKLDAIKKENEELKRNLWKSKPEEKKIADLRKSIYSKDRKLEDLEKEFAVYKEITEQGYEIVKNINDDVKDSVVLLEKSVDARLLHKKSPKAIIADFFIDIDIPVISKERLKLKKIGNYTVVSKKEIEKAIREPENFISWLKDYKESRLYG